MIVVPVSLRIAYYRDSIARLSVYQMLFLEPELDGINWESRYQGAQHVASTISVGRKSFGGVRFLFSKLRHIDFIVICLISILVFLLKGGLNEPFGWIPFSIAAFVTIIEAVFIFVFSGINEQKRAWKVTWERVKANERKSSD